MDMQNLFDRLHAIYQALDELNVVGTRNCSIVGAIASSMEQIAKELSEEIERQKNEKEKEEDKTK